MIRVIKNADVSSPRAGTSRASLAKHTHFSKLIFSTPNTMAYTRLSLVVSVLFAAASPSGKQCLQTPIAITHTRDIGHAPARNTLAAAMQLILPHCMCRRHASLHGRKRTTRYHPSTHLLDRGACWQRHSLKLPPDLYHSCHSIMLLSK
jgi:hypothetical protein